MASLLNESFVDDKKEFRASVTDHCDYRATKKGHQKEHVESTHEGVRYSCDQCDYRDTTKGHLKEHIESIHEDVLYPCGQCDYRVTTTKGNLKENLENNFKRVLNYENTFTVTLSEFTYSYLFRFNITLITFSNSFELLGFLSSCSNFYQIVYWGFSFLTSPLHNSFNFLQPHYVSRFHRSL